MEIAGVGWGAALGNEEVPAASGGYVRVCRFSFLNLFAQARQIILGDSLSSKHSSLGCDQLIKMSRVICTFLEILFLYPGPLSSQTLKHRKK